MLDQAVRPGRRAARAGHRRRHARQHLSTSFRSRHLGLLGTVIEVTALVDDERAGAVVDRAVVAEIERLQRVFDVFDAGSALSRWLRDEIDAPAELITVVDLAETWRARSGGAFDPWSAVLTAAWDHAAARGVVPSDDELATLVSQMHAADRPTAPYSLNAIAKGWIVDRALAVAFVDCAMLTVNAGGDLAHRGSPPITAGIEDPHRAYDNVPPLLSVTVQDGALATSGGARRGWTIDGVRYSHVLDPRTGRPVDHHASVSVLAPDAATADVVATVVGVLATADALTFVDTLDGVECVLVSRDREVTRSSGWPISGSS